jgi:integrase/recombinase XerD
MLDLRRSQAPRLAEAAGGETVPRRRDRSDEEDDRKATNVYDRGGIKWARFQVAGREFRGSLSTSNEKVARKRARAWRAREIGIAKFGEDRKTYAEAFTLWTPHIADQVSATTAERYACSLGQLEEWLKPLYVDEIDKETVSDHRPRAPRQGRHHRHHPPRPDRAIIRHRVRDRRGLEGREQPGRTPPEEAEGAARPDPAAAGRGHRLRDRTRARQLRQNDRGGPGLRLPAGRACQGRAQAAGPRSAAADHPAQGQPNPHHQPSEAAYTVMAAIPAHLKAKWLFWHGNGEPYRNVSARFNELVKAAQKAAQAEEREFRPFTFHHLRHYYAVWFLKNGGNIYALQQHLNHKSITTTEGYLDFLTPEEALRAKHGPSQIPAQIERFEGS